MIEPTTLDFLTAVPSCFPAFASSLGPAERPLVTLTLRGGLRIARLPGVE